MKKKIALIIGIVLVVVLLGIPFFMLMNIIDSDGKDSAYLMRKPGADERKQQEAVPDDALRQPEEASPPSPVSQDNEYADVPDEEVERLAALSSGLNARSGGICGNSLCEGLERCDTCPRDCSCVPEDGESCFPERSDSDFRGCYSAATKDGSSSLGQCGDNICIGEETCGTCPLDCGCGSTMMCSPSSLLADEQGCLSDADKEYFEEAATLPDDSRDINPADYSAKDCGDSVCQQYEHCSMCDDCACAEGYVCTTSADSGDERGCKPDPFYAG